MFPLFYLFMSYDRDRRAAVRLSAPVALVRGSHAKSRMRKGVRAATKSLWRRNSTGSNHISAFGVWRDRSRRAMTRLNRTGETRWHRLAVAERPANRSAMP